MFKNRIFSIICVLLLAAALAACGRTPAPTPTEAPQTESPAPAADPRAEALSAYRDVLEAAPALEGEHPELEDASFGYEQNLQRFGEHYDAFALADLDGDGVPELIAQTVVNFRWTPVSVFTYTDGSAVLLKSPLDPASPATLEQNSSANGAYTLLICGEDHLHSLWRGDTPVGEMTEEQVFALEGGALTLTDCPLGESESSVYFSDIAQTNTAENRDAILR